MRKKTRADFAEHMKTLDTPERRDRLGKQREAFAKAGAPPHRPGDRYCSCCACIDKLRREVR